ncbi:hypothetical protein VOLCADRAFT_100302 [Volvox carteri f. nagariensis]|uniref:Uncharacterized protein n=1 Tax=Volvox carteri f. nagariensis TaxID=3068 RepID=D8UJY5_VOLCA|nr:uncharacterized protein VOLCADRAFT_100302 [Volvox carteri f. nagariensis]EFJ39955.1 hypothetical protein VOLCADRAFT_100302 [Volvox carteri f. nagariensis]|eukprot:XP_002958980.1 hypothetical protein VOLCADRAFT_100302 [Volvox carteri f. nagariensis]
MWPYEHSSLWQLLSIISAFLTTISASKGLPPIELPQSPSDYYSDLITVSSKVYGEVKKSGPLPAERYDEKLFNQSAFRDWLLLKVVYRENVTVPAPMSYRCGVFVNHDYKLIFIRNRKAASTTVLDTFKTACKSQKVMCMKPFSEEEMEARGLTHDAMWNSYYVISSTRNPWARAANGYDYAQDRYGSTVVWCTTRMGSMHSLPNSCIRTQKGRQLQVASEDWRVRYLPFRQFCTNPYLLGTMGNMFCKPYRQNCVLKTAHKGESRTPDPHAKLTTNGTTCTAPHGRFHAFAMIKMCSTGFMMTTDIERDLVIEQ